MHVAGACAPCTRALVRASTLALVVQAHAVPTALYIRTYACMHARAHANTSARSHRAAHSLAPTYSPALTPPAPCSPFFVAALCFAVSQLTKLILNYLETKELHWERLWGSGGGSGVQAGR